MGSLYAVTGGTGFLGTHVVDHLLQDGHRVRILARTNQNVPHHHQQSATSNIEVIPGSILDTLALDALLADISNDVSSSNPISGIFHLAGVVDHLPSAERAMHDANITGTLNVLRAAKKAGIKRVVYASTSGTVGVSEEADKIADDSSPYAVEITAKWPYYRTKTLAEEQGLQFAKDNGIELVCLRPSLLLGPGDRRLSSCRTVLDLLNRKIPFVPGGGLSFVDVRDVASAFVAAMTKGQANKTYLLGALNLTCEDYFNKIATISGVPAPWLKVPSVAAWAMATSAFGLMGLFGRWDPSLSPILVEMSQHFWYIDSSRAVKELGFSARDPHVTLQDTIEWIKSNEKELKL